MPSHHPTIPHQQPSTQTAVTQRTPSGQNALQKPLPGWDGSISTAWTSEDILQLQRIAGNRSVTHILTGLYHERKSQVPITEEKPASNSPAKSIPSIHRTNQPGIIQAQWLEGEGGEDQLPWSYWGEEGPPLDRYWYRRWKDGRFEYQFTMKDESVPEFAEKWMSAKLLTKRKIEVPWPWALEEAEEFKQYWISLMKRMIATGRQEETQGWTPEEIEHYDSHRELHSKVTREIILEVLEPYLKKEPPPLEEMPEYSIIEIGSGTGFLRKKVLNLLPSWLLTETEPSASLLATRPGEGVIQVGADQLHTNPSIAAARSRTAKNIVMSVSVFDVLDTPTLQSSVASIAQIQQPGDLIIQVLDMPAEMQQQKLAMFETGMFPFEYYQREGIDENQSTPNKMLGVPLESVRQDQGVREITEPGFPGKRPYPIPGWTNSFGTDPGEAINEQAKMELYEKMALSGFTYNLDEVFSERFIPILTSQGYEIILNEPKEKTIREATEKSKGRILRWDRGLCTQDEATPELDELVIKSNAYVIVARKS